LGFLFRSPAEHKGLGDGTTGHGINLGPPRMVPPRPKEKRVADRMSGCARFM
jgi:hypothetical protein